MEGLNDNGTAIQTELLWYMLLLLFRSYVHVKQIFIQKSISYKESKTEIILIRTGKEIMYFGIKNLSTNHFYHKMTHFYSPVHKCASLSFKTIIKTYL